MNKQEWTKTKGFRLPERTLNQLDYLVGKGAGRNATEVVIIAIELLATQYETREEIISPSSLMQQMIAIANEKTETGKFLKEVAIHLRDQDELKEQIKKEKNESN